MLPSFSGEIGHSSDGISDLVHDFRSKRKYFYWSSFHDLSLEEDGGKEAFPYSS